MDLRFGAQGLVVDRVMVYYGPEISLGENLSSALVKSHGLSNSMETAPGLRTHRAGALGLI